MKVTRTLLIGASALALAASSAFAARSKDDPGFNALDKNNDGYLSRAEAARNPTLVKNFKQADKNGDGKLSRTEYLSVMTKKDLHSAKQKVTGEKDRNAATGSSKPANKQRKE
jgi:Ca2+-binding EF-hand superfamily protein